MVSAAVSIIKYVIGFKWDLAALDGGERAEQPGRDLTTPAPVAASSLLFQRAIIETNGSKTVVHVHL